MMSTLISRTSRIMAAVLMLVTVCAALGADEFKAPVLNKGGVPGEGGVIKGIVKFAGEQRPRKPIRMTADAFCDQAHKTDPALSESYVFGDNDTLQNVFVYVSSGIDPVSTPPSEPAHVDQHGCMYVPHVRGVVAGQEVKILNSDNTLHNVKITSEKNGNSNDAMPVPGMVLTKKFTKPEMGVSFKCDVHPWMGATVYVMPHPYFAVTQQDGTFEIDGLPPGEYTLSVIHEFKFFEPDKNDVKVTVTKDTPAEVTFTYAPRKR